MNSENITTTMYDRVPSDSEIEDAVRTVIHILGRVESQKELRELVISELAEEDCRIRTTPARVRRIAISSGAAEVEIDYRESSRAKLPELCPVCKNSMSGVRAMNLDGDVVEVKRRCTVCPYSATGMTKAPARYAFVIPACETSDTEERMRKLRKAAANLRIARGLIQEALEGTPLQGRKDFSDKTIEEILSSVDEPGSIRNLTADLREEEGPLWTRPLDSPKKDRRKDGFKD